jgi:erythromycin esterase-like protein
MARLHDTVQPLAGRAGDYDRLLERVGDARLVLIGEASHGTHEFYAERARITRRLIVEKGFTAVAAEADWPDAWRVNRWVRGRGADRSAVHALDGFQRFPSWMWRNDVVADFVTWLRAHNESLDPGQLRTGFYGLDLYSMFSSMEAVLRYLDKVDPAAARRARDRYACFDHFGVDSQAYGYAASYGIDKACENQVIAQLVDMTWRAGEYAGRDGQASRDEFFSAEQNARLVKNAEEYYRTMFRGRISSWNLRDRHMGETLDALLAHLELRTASPKIVVWAHNSHLGDARATEMGEAGELNLGQLARERYGLDAFLIGFSTYAGTVTAASDWDAPSETKRVRAGLPVSYEALFHELGMPAFLLMLGHDAAPDDLPERRLQRAIGVIYRPETERQSHYFHARLAAQFDALIHIDETHALKPLERWSEKSAESPETFPTGM